MSNSNEDNVELVRQTIRILPSTKKRLFLLMRTGEYVTESEIIRRALDIGITKMEKE